MAGRVRKQLQHLPSSMASLVHSLSGKIFSRALHFQWLSNGQSGWHTAPRAGGVFQELGNDSKGAGTSAPRPRSARSHRHLLGRPQLLSLRGRALDKIRKGLGHPAALDESFHWQTHGQVSPPPVLPFLRSRGAGIPRLLGQTQGHHHELLQRSIDEGNQSPSQVRGRWRNVGGGRGHGHTHRARLSLEPFTSG